jgi:hypothetical protein
MVLVPSLPALERFDSAGTLRTLASCCRNCAKWLSAQVAEFTGYVNKQLAVARFATRAMKRFSRFGYSLMRAVRMTADHFV